MPGRASFDLRGVNVLVTASSRGIGFYAARGLARLGASVAISSRSREALERAAKEIKEETGVEPIAIQADLTRRDDLVRLVEEAWDGLGGLDALVFNAGNVSCEPCHLEDAGYSDWLEAARLHLVAPGFLTSLLLPRFLRRGSGVFVYLSSVSVKAPMTPFALADVSRAGLVQLAKLVARSYGGRGIRAYTVLLGSFDTPGARRNVARIGESMGLSPEEAWRKLVLEATPLGRVARPEELANLLAFLLSPSAEYMNGATIVMDGAMTPCT
ncbi:SDR family oxidoreductase [Hyperthermus butylicus]|uniref:Dehydrogenase n=1 Tax=Hyperthermus butylicus (strain DSM 5456 / JCM 9403 / PLM1-5) TaxID=415426 RepID=A2BMI9_HYPBU|nr:SDR family oxidoreductase [Hyperthermus butylicus]ABM81200.1 Dehydrogenase [Hyperthermus butylicus DSM 5456]